MWLGEEFTRQLAAQGADLVLVARSADKLKRLAAALQQHSKAQVTVMPADLSSAEEVSRLVTELKSPGLTIHLLINNPGFGLFENFLDMPLRPQMEQLDVNVRALVTLTHAFTPDMVAAKPGGVTNIASTAAFEPLAGADIYAATKAFVLLFSEGLSLQTGENSLAASCLVQRNGNLEVSRAYSGSRKKASPRGNQWRTQHISLVPDLSELHLCEVHLGATEAMFEGGEP